MLDVSRMLHAVLTACCFMQTLLYIWVSMLALHLLLQQLI